MAGATVFYMGCDYDVRGDFPSVERARNAFALPATPFPTRACVLTRSASCVVSPADHHNETGTCAATLIGAALTTPTRPASRCISHIRVGAALASVVRRLVRPASAHLCARAHG